ncbi:adenosine deaminase [Williamsia sp. CHRR-6]|uniref:adenosine deaminase n=1 Tax=Williamsia sp. CHRR-6 TaxID=2835871 RepID=UPI001BD9C9A5|nr:adenosine deaminase [Williamsia sp. CHRR-6]MBT0567458.1 adenosine deaminase [Williamsia sp. CHRR-6]
MSIDDLIARLPKVELHCHLEGSVPAPTFIELAAGHGIELKTTDPEHVYDFFSFLEFLDLYYQVCDALATPADIERGVYDSLVHGKATGNLRYREMFFSPTNHSQVSYGQMVDAMVSGIKAAEADHGVSCRLIADINRRQSPQVAVQLVEAMIAHPSEYVIGLGIDDDEATGPPEMFVDAFTLAGRHGIRRTAHAGELGVAANVRTSLELLGCERIDHGYAMTRDPEVFAFARDSGVHFTGCWFVNNFHEGVFTEGVDPATTGLAQMIRAGLPVSLSTDDPTMIPTDLNAEYASVAATLGLDEAAVVGLARAAIDGSWADDSTKATLRAELDAAAR